MKKRKVGITSGIVSAGIVAGTVLLLQPACRDCKQGQKKGENEGHGGSVLEAVWCHGRDDKARRWAQLDRCEEQRLMRAVEAGGSRADRPKGY